ncbi:peroxisomal N(1)-acetyl-spermine/spermidine oxidase isoform X2 [Cephus cinctus]|uniref:Peroxisomal N(1)-acetyl-spermine/spermidine oxidase isoform X2 n=1 Tax=Cephus cinctus TaxID=211228 RepID=A0AAJ7RMB0_CEPCN|nr:peroxisomal N(1)-acetyl-spermine/spermidine oxidase isoform X2 [Cephus cinctus]
MLKIPKIVIVGAGAAGISAASRLQESGLQNIVILEAENRIGGRVYTTNFSENVVELGAQWVHGERNNVVFDLASPLNLLDSSRNINDFTKYTFVDVHGNISSQEQCTEVLKIYYDISDQAANGLNHMEESYGEYFTREFSRAYRANPITDNSKEDMFLNWVEKFDNSLQCCDSWFEVSSNRLREYWSCEGDHLLNWKDKGYKTLFDLLSRKYPDCNKELPLKDKVVFNKEVSRIDYSNPNRIVLTTTDGCEYIASHVIFTASLGVLKDQHKTIFKPSLSEIKQRTIKGLNIGTANKIFLEFPHRWWPEDSAGFSFGWTESDLKKFIEENGKDNQWLCDVFQFFTVDYQPRVLCAWIVGPNSRYSETLSDSTVLNGLYFLLETFLSKSYNVPRPDKMIRSKWYTNKHFRGSYTFQSMTSEKMNVFIKDLAEPITTPNGTPLVLFAGEATNDHYYSTVHGAVETGIREADRLIDHYRACGWFMQLIENYPEHTKIEEQPRWYLKETTKLVIVGAGLAGLTAAKTLEDAGFKDYILLEAQGQVGGRIRSKSWDNDWIEYGAQFLHGDQSKLADLCRHYKLLSDSPSSEAQGYYLRDDGIQVDESLVREIDNLFVGGCEHTVFKTGYDSLTRTIVNGLSRKNLRLNSPVERIEWRSNVERNHPNDKHKRPVAITLFDKTRIETDCVIVTCSLGYLKENHRKMFIPSLPCRLTEGIENLGFGVINKIFLKFEEPWWTPGTKGFQFLWSKNQQNIFKQKLPSWTRDLTGFDVLANHRAVLLGWIGGRGAQIIESLSERQILNDCVNLLKIFLKKDDIPIAKKCKRTQWKSDKYARGSYSHISVKCDDLGISPATLAEPVWATVQYDSQSERMPVIMLAGEATHENFYSTTHGAFDTGIKQAQIFLRYHSSDRN